MTTSPPGVLFLYVIANELSSRMTGPPMTPIECRGGSPRRRVAKLHDHIQSRDTASDYTHYTVAQGRIECDPSKRLARWPPGGDGFPPMTVPQKFAERVEKMGDKPALHVKRSKSDTEWTIFTWAEYFSDVKRVAKSLMFLGLEKHQAINILASNVPEWFFAAMGGIFCGGVSAGIYITNNAAAVGFIISHSRARIVFVDSATQLDKVLTIQGDCEDLLAVVVFPFSDIPSERLGGKVLGWDSFLAMGDAVTDHALAERMSDMLPDNACYLSYTSGTTGPPKAVMYSHDNVLWAYFSLCSSWDRSGCNFGMQERSLNFLPMSHVAGTVDMFMPLACNFHTNISVFFAFSDALQGSLPSTLVDVQPTMLLAVPRVWEKLEAHMKLARFRGLSPHALVEAAGLQSLKFGETGAAPTARATIEYFESVGISLCESYGMTENVRFACGNTPHRRMVGTIGTAHGSRTSGEGGRAEMCTYEGTNEICTRSRATMMGYMRDPEKSLQAVDAQGWVHTGDIGEVSTEGFYSLVGRTKEIIITAGGENVAPVLIEDILKQELPAIANCVVVGDRQKYLIALFTPKLEPDGKGAWANTLAAEAAMVDSAHARTAQQARRSEVWADYLASGVARANAVIVSRAQNIRKWALLQTDFSSAGPDAELTPTLKLKRDTVHQKYAKSIKDVYGKGDYAELIVRGKPI